MNERGTGLRSRGEVQDFDKLRAQCRRSGRLFEDPEFPASDCSIFFSRTPPRPFQWKRPHEITDGPRFIRNGASRFDIKQGELGDCWVLAAVASITMSKELFARVVPDDQEIDDDYAGIFHFRFWQYGRWVDVVIDDRLPTYHGQLAFMHSADNHEFWSALLEKAYAKLHGSYEALEGGQAENAMEDFSGGLCERYTLDKAPDNLLQIMLKAHQRHSPMSCAIRVDSAVVKDILPSGLMQGHAYSVTKACMADIETPRVRGKIPMVRVRNPWGNEAEWNGAFSDSSPEWNFIPDGVKKQLGLTVDADGEFWMTFKGFTKHFEILEICNLSPDSLDDDDDSTLAKRWEMSMFEGAWVRGATAGGCRNYIDTFAHNPQYSVQLEDVDEDDEEGKCTVIVALMQKNRRAQNLACLQIGFCIYDLSDSHCVPKPLDVNFFRHNASVAHAPAFINLREVSCRFKLPPGTYCIIPSTFEPNEESEFLIRIFSEKANNMEENDEEVGPGRVVELAPDEEPGHEVQMSRAFLRVAGDNQEVDWHVLKTALDDLLKGEFMFEGFSKDTVRSMIALVDADNSGQLGLEEFKSLWSSIRLWKSVFRRHDRSGSCFLNGFELRSALNESGYHVNSNLLNSLMHRYGDREGRVAFDDFIACAVKMKIYLELFKARDLDGDHRVTFTLDEWMRHGLYS
ncbi:calpain-B-like [Pollicipes pollicipes]|uniref:calpain-B-like n=1 Tax=Pollicipes pollicipes TaxID=41117 RepID=UPI0018858494|nr:calpain-B-like [Pollicipes pollicipes]